MNTALDVTLQKSFPGFQLDIRFQLQNSLTVLFGYSGSGKTVTLRMISGLLQPDRGEISLNGRTLFSSEEKSAVPIRERNIGYVFQHDALFPHMNVRQNVAYGVKSGGKKIRMEIAAELIARFQLLQLADKYPQQLSGGQRQRVAFARALAGDPALLLLDEPFSALDLPVRRGMQQLLLEIRSRYNIPVLFVTHDIPEAEALAEQILVYENGRIVFDGAPEAADAALAAHPARELFGL